MRLEEAEGAAACLLLIHTTRDAVVLTGSQSSTHKTTIETKRANKHKPALEAAGPPNSQTLPRNASRSVEFAPGPMYISEGHGTPMDHKSRGNAKDPASGKHKQKHKRTTTIRTKAERRRRIQTGCSIQRAPRT